MKIVVDKPKNLMWLLNSLDHRSLFFCLLSLLGFFLGGDLVLISKNRPDNYYFVFISRWFWEKYFYYLIVVVILFRDVLENFVNLLKECSCEVSACNSCFISLILIL